MARFISDELPEDDENDASTIDLGFIQDAFTDPALFRETEKLIADADPAEDFLAKLPELDADDLKLLEEVEDEPEVEVQLVEEGVTGKKPRKPKNYINNADLMYQVSISREQDQMTNELVKMLTMLCARYATRGQFSGYSYVDDMKAYAMYMIVRTWRAFNPEKGSNPFAFYTQCIKNSFIQYLKKESNERDIRDQLLVEAGLNPSFGYGDSDDGDSGNADY